jgi:phosphoenolpyruvate-protein kinase (PTS system EI component)
MLQAAQEADLKVLIPLVSCAGDVHEVRARSAGRLEVGAMIETPEGVAAAGEISGASDFVCIGTNDLHAVLSGRGREDDSCTLDPRLVHMVAEVVREAHARGCPVTVCGELAADPLAARVFAGLGVDGLSVATSRFDQVKRDLHAASRAECDALAGEAVGLRPGRAVTRR